MVVGIVSRGGCCLVRSWRARTLPGVTSPPRVLVIGLALLTLVAGGAWWRLRPDVGNPSDALIENLKNLRGQLAGVLEATEFLTSTPGPLRAGQEGAGAPLTRPGILQWTNNERERAGRKPLAEDPVLTNAAERKLADMFARQYFAHDNPDGNGISVVVQDLGYAFLRVGENLALGNFGSDADLVAAWMASPGHRENLLSPGFTEIGIAVAPGTFEGRRTWMAVQVFALPASACPSVDADILARARREETALKALAAELDTERDAIEAERNRLSALAAEIERLVAEGNATIAEGNAEVEEGNRISRDTGDADAARPHWERGKQLQEEGRAKHAEAKAKEEELAAARTVLAERVADFNARLATYTQRRTALEKLVATYNAQVRALNTCVQRAGNS